MFKPAVANGPSAMQMAMDALLPKLFGYFLLHLGPEDTLPLSVQASVKRRIHLYPQHAQDIQAKWHQLPLRQHSIDMSYVVDLFGGSHAVEKTIDEMSRVTRYEGYLIFSLQRPKGRLSRWRLWAKKSRLCQLLHQHELTPVLCQKIKQRGCWGQKTTGYLLLSINRNAPGTPLACRLSDLFFKSAWQAPSYPANYESTSQSDSC